MNVIKNIINSDNFFPYLIALILSTLFIGYAPSSIALGLFVFFSITYAVLNKKKLKIDRTLLLPVILYLFLVSTIIWSIDTKLTSKGIGRLLALFLVPLAFVCIPKFSVKKRDLVLKYFTYANVGYAFFFLLVALFNYYKTRDLNVFTYHNLVKVLDLNAIYVSVFFSISLYYLIAKKEKQIKDKLGVFFFINLIVLLASKMIIVILIVSVSIYLFLFKGAKYFKNYKTLIALAIIAITVALNSKQIISRLQEENRFTKFHEVLNKEKFNKTYLWTGTSLRLFQLRLLKEQIQEDKIFFKGFGLFASRINLKEKHQKYNTYRGFHSYNYHNQYAQVMAEGGIVALLLLFLMLSINFVNALKSKDFLFITFGVILFMLFFTESFLWVQRGVIFTSVLFCLFNRTFFCSLESQNN